MEDTGKNIGDILGLAPYGESLKIVTKGGIEGISKFLDITCRPLLEELGLWARDNLRVWRFKNLYDVLSKAKEKVTYKDGQIVMVNPRLGYAIAENASLVEDDEIQNMWAGLFAASISSDGKDDSNLIFINLLKQLTSVQAHMLRYAFDNCRKVKYENGLITGCKFTITLEEAYVLFQINDLDRLDRELDSLNSLGLIDGGLSLEDKDLEVDLSLSSLGIYLISRCQGNSIVDYSMFITEQEYKAHPEYHSGGYLAIE